MKIISLFADIKFLSGNKFKSLYLIFFLSFFIGLLETIGIGSIFAYISAISDLQLFQEKVNDLGFAINFGSLDEKKIITIFSILLILFFVLKNITILLFNYLETFILQSLFTNISKKIFNKFLKQNYTYFSNKNSSSTIIMILNETKRSADFIFNIVTIFREIIVCVFISILLMMANLKISIALVLSFLFLTFTYYFIFAKRSKILGEQIRVINSNLLQLLTESLSFIKVLKLQNIENQLVENYKKKLNFKKFVELKFSIIGKIPKAIFEVFSVALILLIIYLLISEEKNIKEFLPLISLIVISIIRLLPSILLINSSLNKYKYNIQAFNKIKNFLEEKITFLENKSDKEIINKNINSIVIKDLSFSFETKIIFENTSIELNKGNIYGINAPSGLGKTTFLDLLTGIIKPQKGQIIYNSQFLVENIKFTPEVLGYVPQSVFLIDGSIKQNISFDFSENISDHKKFETCTKLAEIHDLIKEKENFLDFELGEQGSKISGGQKQRIGIARALFNNPSVLILDESTNAIDVATEEKIINNLNLIKKEKIILISSHKNKILEKCDYVLNINNYKITQKN